MAEDTSTDVEQPKPSTEETQKTAPADDVASAGSQNGEDIGSSLIKPTGELSEHEQALLVSSRRDMNDTRTKPFVVIVAIAAALGGLIFGYDSKCNSLMTVLKNRLMRNESHISFLSNCHTKSVELVLPLLWMGSNSILGGNALLTISIVSQHLVMRSAKIKA
jgi:hypothetical protein